MSNHRLTFPQSDKVNRQLFVTGQDPEAASRQAVLRLGQCRRRACEIGAHVGQTTLHLSDVFNHVHAFEPHAATHACLQANAAGRNITVHRLGVGASRGLGYVTKLGLKDGRERRVQTEQFKESARIPVVTVDAFGWDDLDLLRITGVSSWTEVLQGATATLARCRPTLWITARDRAEMVAAAFDMLVPLGRLGYRVVANEALELILSAGQEHEAAPVPPPRLVGNPANPRKHLLLPHTDGGALGGSGTVIGRTLVRSEARLVRSDQGRAFLHVADVNAGFKFVGTNCRVILNSGAVLDLPRNAATTDLYDALAAAVSLVPDAAGAILSIPADLAAVCDHVTIAWRSGGEEHLILWQRVEEMENVSRIRAFLPLDALREGPGEYVARLMHGDLLILERTAAIDIGQQHIHAETVNCYQNRAGGGIAVMEGFAAGLGARLIHAEDGYRPGVAVVWGVLRGSKAVLDESRARGGIFYYVDHAYFSRGHGRNYRVCRNGFDAGPVHRCPDDRLRQLRLQVAPWRHGGGPVIVCPPTQFFMQAHACEDWLASTLATLRQHTDRELIIREKPQTGSLQPLEEALMGAHALVTHSSNVAIEAVVLGTPVFVAPASAAAPVGLTDLSRIEAPVCPDRMPWLAHLAYSQFSMEEIRSGEVWRLLAEHAERPLVPVMPTLAATRVMERA